MLNLAVVTKTIQLDTIKLSSIIGEKHFRGPKVREKTIEGLYGRSRREVLQLCHTRPLALFVD